MRIKISALLSFLLVVGLAVWSLFLSNSWAGDNQARKDGFYAANAASWPPLDPNDPKGEKVVLVADSPLVDNYYFVVDFSGSMSERACGSRDSKAEVVKRVVPEFLLSIPSKANIGLLIFDREGVKERVPLGPVQKNRKAFLDSIKDAKPSNGTPLSTAIEEGYKKLVEQGRRQHGYGGYRLIIITDGEANLGYNPERIVNDISTYSPVIIDTIGFCINGKHSLNQRGKTVYREADSPEALRAGLKEVLAESPIFDAKEFK